MRRNSDLPERGHLSDRLRRFSALVTDDSPLYARICEGAAEDPTVHEILETAAYQQPAANLLLAAVHYLLLRGAGPALAAHYPSVTDAQQPATGDPVTLFAAFCRDHREELIEIVSTRTVQTNEVRRCTALLPAFGWVARQTQSPLALIEIGSSAGLNLVFDRYRYDYGNGLVAGDPRAVVTLSTELRGGRDLPVDPFPTVVWRRGIDLHPVDVTDPDAVDWLRALLWPEQSERMERFEAAVAVARTDPPTLVAGDAIDVIGEITTSVPDEATLIVFHSFVLNQFSPAARGELTQAIAGISQTRDVHRIGVDMTTRTPRPPRILHTAFRGSAAETTDLGSANHHGAWLEWSP